MKLALRTNFCIYRLYIHGSGLYPPKSVVLNELNPRAVETDEDIPNDAHVGFDEALLKDISQLELGGSITTLDINTILGDMTSFMKIKDQESWYIEFEELEPVR